MTRLTCSGICGVDSAEGAAGSPFCIREPSTVLLALVLMTGIRSNRPALYVRVCMCVSRVYADGEGKGEEGGGERNRGRGQVNLISSCLLKMAVYSTALCCSSMSKLSPYFVMRLLIRGMVLENLQKIIYTSKLK